MRLVAVPKNLFTESRAVGAVGLPCRRHAPAARPRRRPAGSRRCGSSSRGRRRRPRAWEPSLCISSSSPGVSAYGSDSRRRAPVTQAVDGDRNAEEHRPQRPPASRGLRYGGGAKADDGRKTRRRRPPGRGQAGPPSVSPGPKSPGYASWRAMPAASPTGKTSQPMSAAARRSPPARRTQRDEPAARLACDTETASAKCGNTQTSSSMQSTASVPPRTNAAQRWRAAKAAAGRGRAPRP